MRSYINGAQLGQHFSRATLLHLQITFANPKHIGRCTRCLLLARPSLETAKDGNRRGLRGSL